MYLLKPLSQSAYNSSISYLHSTMYLLKLKPLSAAAAALGNLHSTMYLLKPKYDSLKERYDTNLHSTMYLLKLISDTDRRILFKFTFHYVSIKTKPTGTLIRLNKRIYIPLCIY